MEFDGPEFFKQKHEFMVETFQEAGYTREWADYATREIEKRVVKELQTHKVEHEKLKGENKEKTLIALYQDAAREQEKVCQEFVRRYLLK